jgi:two-component system, cell cycle sensor histidine kinase and response regulator CckA
MAIRSRPPGALPATAPNRKQRPPSECTALNRDQLRLLSESFARTGPEGMRPPSEGIISLIEIGLNLGTERDPVRLLKALCRTARNILGARQAIIAVGEGNGDGLKHVLTSGVDDADEARLLGDPLQSALLNMSIAKCVRGVNPDGVPGSAGLPAAFPEVFAYLAAPIRSLAQSFGWICFIDKTGGHGFQETDENLATTLASQIGRIYERNCLNVVPIMQTRVAAPTGGASAGGVADLRASEELFRSAFDHTNVAMALTDIDNQFFRVNSAFAHLFGYTQAELLQMSMPDVTHPDDVEESYTRREALLRGDRQFFQIEKRYIHKSGRTIWGLTNVALMRGRSGEPLVYIEHVQDVTDKTLAEAELCKERQ